MGSSESKPSSSSSKTETNTSLVQFHWTSYGIGAASIILGILALGLVILIFYFIKAKCCKMFDQPRAEYGFNPWIPMGPLGSNLAQVGGLPYTPPVREIPDPTSPNQLALTSALSRIHNEPAVCLQNYP